jgi:RimJ/RimL family protein N-acetyltransferase
MVQRAWFPEVLEGSQVVLRRHRPENIAAFQRWYADPEIARLARYQATPMRPEEIERFFAARVVGPDALAMAVHEKATDRLVGTCAFSQLDGENGSALYHITIGESDAWGKGFGTEATQLMLDHAFGTLGLHRIALYVFEFNERAIRAYRRCGFVVEGRSRESIWRDGRWWDEMAMSVLESDWRKRREAALASGGAGPKVHRPKVVKPAAAEPATVAVDEPVADAESAKAAVARVDEPVAAGTSTRVRRTLGRWR